MPEQPHAPTALSRRVISLIVFVLLLAVAICFQSMEGVYRSEFGGHPDEAAHYVTGLFVHDSLVFAKNYAVSGFHGSPVAATKGFVTSFYAHYPKIGLGVWPPVFYLVQASWTLVTGSSRGAVLVLMAVIASGVGCLIFKAVREEYGIAAGLVAAVLWMSLPVVQEYYGMVMAEMLSAFGMFAATLAFGRFLDRGQRKDAILFGLWASAAILTKGTGLALAFVPVISIVLTSRYSLLKRKALWVAGGLVAVIAGPWTMATRKLGEGGWEEPHPSLHFTKLALPYYSWTLVVALGGLLVCLALVGVVARFSRRDSYSGKWACCFALIISIIVFQSIAPAGREARHLIPALPAALMFAVAGFYALTGLAPMRFLRPASALALLAIFYGLPELMSSSGKAAPTYGSIGDHLAITPFGIHQKGAFGFGEVAAKLMSLAPHGKFLVSSDATGEGMFIAEVAMHDTGRPNRTAKRASKELSTSLWGGGGYKPKYEAPDALIAYLTSGAVDYVVVDTAIPDRNRKPHHELLQKVTASRPDLFEPVMAPQPLFRNNVQMPGPILAYRIHHA